jgi:hypothetical protein
MRFALLHKKRSTLQGFGLVMLIMFVVAVVLELVTAGKHGMCEGADGKGTGVQGGQERTRALTTLPFRG